MTRILFLDDDASQMKYHVKALEGSFVVVLRNQVDRALRDFKDLKERDGPWGGAIIDVMMPPGKLGSSSPNGMRTGWSVLSELREVQPDIPVIVVTNSRDEQVKEWFRLERRVRVLDKLDLLPDELLTHAKEFFGSASEEPAEPIPYESETDHSPS